MATMSSIQIAEEITRPLVLRDDSEEWKEELSDVRFYLAKLLDLSRHIPRSDFDILLDGLIGTAGPLKLSVLAPEPAPLTKHPTISTYGWRVMPYPEGKMPEVDSDCTWEGIPVFCDLCGGQIRQKDGDPVFAEMLCGSGWHEVAHLHSERCQWRYADLRKYKRRQGKGVRVKSPLQERRIKTILKNRAIREEAGFLTGFRRPPKERGLLLSTGCLDYGRGGEC